VVLQHEIVSSTLPSACLAAIPVKWAMCFTLLRAAENRRTYQVSTWIIMAMAFLVMASTFVYESIHCTSMKMNWKAAEGFLQSAEQHHRL
jgi:hypothetical protein